MIPGKKEKEQVRLYRKFVYETGATKDADKPCSKTIGAKIVEKEQKRDFAISREYRFMYWTRYFTVFGIIGSRGGSNRIHRPLCSRCGGRRGEAGRRIGLFIGWFGLHNVLSCL